MTLNNIAIFIGSFIAAAIGVPVISTVLLVGAVVGSYLVPATTFAAFVVFFIYVNSGNPTPTIVNVYLGIIALGFCCDVGIAVFNRIKRT
jgi:hypothetical protein